MSKRVFNLTESQLKELARAAWECQERAYAFSGTKVGAAVMSSDGSIFVGCNVEHQFRSHDVHAEVNAITSMVAKGRTELIAIIIVAERELFTPCGACMDWIFQFGSSSCLVAYQSKKEGKIHKFRAKNLMPHYPKR